MDNCIEWTGYRLPQGYGQRSIKGRLELAHRVAWIEIHGPIPDGMYICHHCDNPPCINPDHLFIGTPADNVADRDAKGRQNYPRGSSHPRAKLTEDDVLAIRATPRYHGINRDMAKRYDVSPRCISDIRARQKWTHI